MASIYFVGTYPPIMCGLATYTGYITREASIGKHGVLSFDLERYGAPLTEGAQDAADPVWYGIPDRNTYSAEHLHAGLRYLGAKRGDAILWFQHEAGIWADQGKFVRMLRDISIPKVVTFHTLHFQSDDTESGLRGYQYDLLRAVLPHVDAITVFTYGVYFAVISAFPQYCHKIHIVNHGVHQSGDISRMSREQARRKLHDFLLSESTLDPATMHALDGELVFTDPNAILLGQTGFLCPLKHSESLFYMRDRLQELRPERRIIALRIGGAREESHRTYARQLRCGLEGSDKFLLEMWLPEGVLPLAMRAFDVNFYWPNDCTQSGVISHALGAGAIIAGRDMEGVGETLKQVGMLVNRDIDALSLEIRDAVLNPEAIESMEDRARRYASDFSWEKQAERHRDLAEAILYAASPWAGSCVANNPTPRDPDPLEMSAAWILDDRPGEVGRGFPKGVPRKRTESPFFDITRRGKRRVGNSERL